MTAAASRDLLPAHRAQLEASAISAEVAVERGYFSVERPVELERLGFGRQQRRVPALLIPICGVTGEIATYQVRADQPRVGKNGKAIKYETPGGTRMVLDVPPRVRPMLGDPAVPLFVTEGVKKADAAASQRLCCIALLGVWNWRGTNEHGGKVALPDWESIALNGRTIYVVFDSDVMTKSSVHQALVRLKPFLESRKGKVQLVYLPTGNDGAKVGLDDFLAAGHTVENLLELATSEVRNPAASARSQGDLPKIIVTNRPLREITTDALHALAQANEPPSIFVRSGALARVRTDENSRPIIETMTESQLRGRLSRVADFVSVSQEREKHVAPPLDVVRDVLALGAWQLPPLVSMVESPVLRPDGSVLSAGGYDAATGLYYAREANAHVLPIPNQPAPDMLRAAIALIKDDLLGDFPFIDAASRANFIGTLLTPILRPAIRGQVPLALLDKPGPGTGASLLSELVSVIATGRAAAMMTAPCNDEEWRKKITATLMMSTTVVTIDNVIHPLGSAALSAALTASVWEDRVLGRSEIVRLAQRATWLATGNNLQLAGDTGRRSYWIRLDARMNRPWQRNEFRHPRLLDWVRQHRGELLAALLILARGWYAAGSPKADVPVIGGFEDWAETVAGVLALAGVEGFLTNLDELYDQIDEEAVAWEGFCSTWHGVFGERPVTVAELTAHIQEDGSTLSEALPADLAAALEAYIVGKGSFPRRLGKALAARKDRVHGTLRLERASDDAHDKVARWQMRGLRGFVPSNAQATEGDNREPVVRTPRNGRAESPPLPANPATCHVRPEPQPYPQDDPPEFFEGEIK